MSRRIFGSLSVQLFCGVLLAGAAFLQCFFLGTQILGRTVCGEPFMDKMAGQQFQGLQSYVTRERVTAKNIHQLNLWCGHGNNVSYDLSR